MINHLTRTKVRTVTSALTWVKEQARSNAAAKWIVLALMFYTALLYYTMRTHIIWHSMNVWLGVIALPMVTVIRYGEKGSLRYGWLALLLSVACSWIPVKTLYYGALFLSLMFVVESFIGRMNHLPLLVVGLMSPMFQYLSKIFSFPVRLQLSSLAGSMMNWMGLEVSVRGNMLLVRGSEFSVDPACMGVNMIVTSLLLQVLLVAVYQKRYQRTATWWHLILLLVAACLFNLFANLARIICLVEFNIAPGAAMHEIMGLLCWIVYVVLPAVLLTRCIVKRFGKKEPEGVERNIKATRPWKIYTAQLVLAGMMLLSAGVVVAREQAIRKMVNLPDTFEGYQVEQVYNDVIRLQHAESLVYIKPVGGFYSADHNPMICWQGSGYELKEIEVVTVQNIQVYMARLENEKDTLHTAWWYQEGSNCTIGQATWRWNTFTKNVNYSLINATANSRDRLKAELKTILSTNRFGRFLQQIK